MNTSTLKRYIHSLQNLFFNDFKSDDGDNEDCDEDIEGSDDADDEDLKGILPKKILLPEPHILESNGVW